MKLSQGFHTKLKVSSPLSLALGIEGLAEILDIELSSPLPIEEVRLRLESERVEGLGIVDVQPLDRASARARVTAQEYLCRVPGDVDESALRRRAEELLSGPCLIVDRRTPGKPDRQVDIRPRIDTLAVQDHEIRMRLWVTDGASARPEEVLRALGLQDTINEGSLAVTRTQVELTRRDDLSALPAHG
jgi:radical SAM-linked protein